MSVALGPQKGMGVALYLVYVDEGGKRRDGGRGSSSLSTRSGAVNHSRSCLRLRL